MSVTVKFAVAERTAEQFNTAVFRFMELKMARADAEPIVRIADTPSRGWQHKELEFTSPELAEEFGRYVRQLHLGLQGRA
jgi:hypothetical protein